MRRFATVLAVMLCFTCAMPAQMVSPLHQVMSSNSLIDRPQVFRDMQEYIASAYGDLPPGIKLDYLYKQMEPLRDSLLSYLLPPTVLLPEQTKIVSPHPQHFSSVRNRSTVARLLPAGSFTMGGDTTSPTLSLTRGLATDVIRALRLLLQSDTSLSLHDSFNVDSLVLYSRYIGFDYRGVQIESICLGDYRTPSALLAQMQQHAANGLGDLLKKYLPHDMGDQTTAAMVAAILTALNQAGIVHTNSLGTESGDYVRAFSGVLAQTVMDKIRQAIRERFPEILLSDKGWDDTLIARIPQLNQLVSDAVSSLREGIKLNLDKAESSVTTAVNEYTRQFLAGNTGFAITEGEGAFTGGVMYAFVSGHFQSGVDINGQFNKSSNNDKSDTTLVAQEFLVGIQFRVATDDTQFDMLFSKLVGENKSSEMEMGFGLSYRISDALIVGAAGFSLVRPADDVYSVGATFKGTSADSPAILIGTNCRSGSEATPIIQLSLPILPKR